MEHSHETPPAPVLPTGDRQRPPGVGAALGAAVLFGVSTPLSKALLRDVSPWMLAGLLYLGAGLGLAAQWMLGAATGPRPTRRDLPWLAGAVFAGGALGPLCLLAGLRATSAASASLLLNLEGVFTALIAWWVFREAADRRLVLGMGLVVAAGVMLSWSDGAAGSGTVRGSLAVVAACLCWAVDNNLTRKVSDCDPRLLAMAKGLIAGTVNASLALASGQGIPAPAALGAALVLGFVSYGLSLVLFVRALRQLGTARTGAYFALAPFVGAAVAVVALRERTAPTFFPAVAMMVAGLWLHLAERHEHPHRHEAMEHTHPHVHDEHHRHAHPVGVDAREGHSHAHRHEAMEHTHPHYPDTHHRHSHDEAARG